MRLSLILAAVGAALGLIGGILISTSIYLNISVSAAGNDDSARVVIRTVGPPAGAEEEQPGSRRALPTLTPTPEQRETPTPTPAAIQPEAPPTSETTSTATASPTAETDDTGPSAGVEPAQTPGPKPTATPAATAVSPTPAPQPIGEATAWAAAGEQNVQYVEPYTSTDQVQPPPSAGQAVAAPVCPVISEAAFDLIPIEGSPVSDHPDFMHADLNLSLRGYTVVSETLALEFYNGPTDPNAPQLHGLFEPNRRPPIKRVYQINEWIWDAAACNGSARGCRGGPVDVFWPVTLVGLATTPGEPIHIPERGPQIYSGGFTAMVLYAEERQITLGYTRRDRVSAGYVVHLMNVCVDPNLLALYQSQKNADGWHTSGFLPALRNNQPLGVAAGGEVLVAVRDVGSFMDPRSEKDWWR